MSDLAARLAAILLALALTASGATLAAPWSAPTLPKAVAPFGCFA
ncbi:MAG TPA: hypothetical protein VGA98_10230 [Allosphingosinicella sp.]